MNMLYKNRYSWLDSNNIDADELILDADARAFARLPEAQRIAVFQAIGEAEEAGEGFSFLGGLLQEAGPGGREGERAESSRQAESRILGEWEQQSDLVVGERQEEEQQGGGLPAVGMDQPEDGPRPSAATEAFDEEMLLAPRPSAATAAARERLERRADTIEGASFGPPIVPTDLTADGVTMVSPGQVVVPRGEGVSAGVSFQDRAGASAAAPVPEQDMWAGILGGTMVDGGDSPAEQVVEGPEDPLAEADTLEANQEEHHAEEAKKIRLPPHLDFFEAFTKPWSLH